MSNDVEKFILRGKTMLEKVIENGVKNLDMATYNCLIGIIKEDEKGVLLGIVVGGGSVIAIVVIVTFLRKIEILRNMIKKIRKWFKNPTIIVGIFKLVVSAIFIGLFMVRIKYPQLKIDAISIILIILAMFPWYSKNIKALELNGIGKVELVSDKEKEELEEKVAKVGISKNVKKENPAELYSFYNIRYTDPKLALAGLRIEIEKELQRIAEKSEINSSYMGVGKLTEELSKYGLITNNEYALIRDIIGVLNKAVHNKLENYRGTDVDWVFELGIDVLESLKQR